MTAEIIYATFDDNRAAQVIDDLRKEGISERSIAIIGPERNQMLPVTAKLIDRTRMHPFVAKTISGGAVLGFLSGLATMFIPNVNAETVIGPLMAAICGAAAGSYIGLVAGAAVAFDNPVWIADVYEGPVPPNKVQLAVRTDSDHESRLQEFFQEAGADQISVRHAA